MCAAENREPTIYVIGAGGFIGAHLVKALGDSGLDLCALSRSAGKSDKIIRVEDYSEAIPEYADFIIHLAEPAITPNLPDFDEQKYLDDRLGLVKELLALKPKWFIYLSSALVGIRDSAYARSKLAVENLVKDYEQSIIIRLGNVYGAGMSSSNIISEVIAQINNGSDHILIKKANVSTSYMHVSDLVKLIEKIISHPKSGTYYVTGTEQISALELAEKIVDIFGESQTQIIAKDYNDKAALECDSRGTQEAFSWYPEIDISTGLGVLKKELGIYP